MPNDLKPCPFCGGEAEPKFDYYEGVSRKHHFWQCTHDPNHRGGVGCYNAAPGRSQPSAFRGSCDKCQAEGQPCAFSIAAWNTRAPASEPVAGILLPPIAGASDEFLEGWCAGQAYLLAAAALSTIPDREKALREAWNDGFNCARNCVSDDVAFELTECVQNDAWLDSAIRAALGETGK